MESAFYENKNGCDYDSSLDDNISYQGRIPFLIDPNKMSRMKTENTGQVSRVEHSHLICPNS